MKFFREPDDVAKPRISDGGLEESGRVPQGTYGDSMRFSKS